MSTIDVADVVVTYRQVDISATCPRCDAALCADGALRVWRFRDEMLAAKLASDPDDVDAEGGVIVDESLPEGGETFIDGIHVSCAACDAVLASGALTVREP